MTEKTPQASTNNLSWTEKKGKLKEQFPSLIDSDLNYETGKRDEMMEKLQTKLGKSKDELSSIIEKL